VDEVVQVAALGLVEVQGTSDAVDDAVGDTGRVPALEPRVVVGRHAGQQRHLLASQTRHASALAAVVG
jgi:hypothetical protein